MKKKLRLFAFLTFVLMIFALSFSPRIQPSVSAEEDLLQFLITERAALEPLIKSMQNMNQKSELGQLLFFDKILSGNRNISCATCHHTQAATSDGLSLPVGEGGSGLGLTRNFGSKEQKVTERVPRNSPHVFNLGIMIKSGLKDMFWDGRVAVSSTAPSGFKSPAGDNLPLGLDNVLAAQAMFPVTSNTEMAGHDGENPIATAASRGILSGENGVWELIAQRIRKNDEYVALFIKVFKDVEKAEDITYVHAANAIATFETRLGLAMDSPFDRYLKGEKGALSANARKGMRLFYGNAGCVTCHSGPLQTDNSYHSIAMIPLGPGKGNGFGGIEDFGRENVTGDSADRYKFRTPSLRNVELTAPWGHSGAFTSLEDVIRHHLNAEKSFQEFQTGNTILPPDRNASKEDFRAFEDSGVRSAILATNEMLNLELEDAEIKYLVAFLQSLTDSSSFRLSRFTPFRVPSRIPVAE